MRAPAFYLGKPVRSLQTMLRQLSDSDNRILPLIPDGFYGPNTYASVRSFQRAYGLPETGIADPVTWNAIVAAHNLILPDLFPPAVSPIWPRGQTIQPGEVNIHLYLVQAMLKALSQIYSELDVPEVNGTLDPVTERDLKWIQAASGLPETGALNTATWHALTGLYRVSTGDGNP